jgi:hypothetical protein
LFLLRIDPNEAPSHFSSTLTDCSHLKKNMKSKYIKNKGMDSKYMNKILQILCMEK